MEMEYLVKFVTEALAISTNSPTSPSVFSLWISLIHSRIGNQKERGGGRQSAPSAKCVKLNKPD